MNRNIIKYIAIIAMTLDHIGSYMLSYNIIASLILKIIGRITFPIMCFFIVEGFKYSKDKKKYALRLLTVALISQIPFSLLRNNTLLDIKMLTELNPIFTLFLGFILLCLIEKDIKLIYKSLLIVVVVSLSFMCDYKIVGLIYILYFYLLSNSKYKYVLLPVLYVIGTYITILINNLQGSDLILRLIINTGLLLTVPIFLLYNNNKGNNHYIHKYFFYFYYPIHLMAIFLINNLL